MSKIPEDSTEFSMFSSLKKIPHVFKTIPFQRFGRPYVRPPATLRMGTAAWCACVWKPEISEG